MMVDRFLIDVDGIHVINGLTGLQEDNPKGEKNV